MTAPRQVIASRTHLLTRSCTQRLLLLRPDSKVTEVYEYCLAEAAEHCGITIHGYGALSNHHHLVVRDNHGNLPEFLARMHRMMAKALNSRWGRGENFWAAEQPNAVHLVESHDRFDKLVYVLANPVAADLVDRVSDWPGACSLPLHLSGRSKVIKRPHGFFRKGGKMPEEVTLRIERVDGFEHLTDTEWRDKLAAAVSEREGNARALRLEKNVRVLGRKAVLRAKHTDQPRSPAPRGGLRPHLACRNRERRRLELAAVDAFRAAHRNARLRWSAGDRTVPFPFGTYRMLAFVVCCAPSPGGRPAVPLG